MGGIFLFLFVVIVIIVFLSYRKLDYKSIISWISAAVCTVLLAGCFFLFMKYTAVLFVLPWMPIVFIGVFLMIGACCTLFIAYVAKKIA